MRFVEVLVMPTAQDDGIVSPYGARGAVSFGESFELLEDRIDIGTSLLQRGPIGGERKVETRA